jgi:FMN phosphatase YigB (HAD superfamily)
MIRAILFDFYGVWTPDRFSQHLAMAQQHNPAVALEIQQAIEKYYEGLVDIAWLAEYISSSFRFKLNNTTVDPRIFTLRPTDVSPALVKFMRDLHGHFLKLGVVANIGKQEYELLNTFNGTYQLLEIIIGSLTIGGSVLSNEAFTKALQDIGEPPDSCLVVTGNDAYQQFAESHGLQVLRFAGFPRLRETLFQLIATKP